MVSKLFHVAAALSVSLKVFWSYNGHKSFTANAVHGLVVRCFLFGVVL